MLDVPARILAREKILSFSSARLPTRSNYLPPTREKIKERGGKEAKKQREREKEKSRSEEATREREPNTRSKKERKGDVWGKGGFACVRSCEGEHRADIRT